MKINIVIDLLDLFKRVAPKRNVMIDEEDTEEIEITDGAVYLGADDSFSSKPAKKMVDVAKANKPELRSSR